MTDEEYKHFLTALAGKHFKNRLPLINLDNVRMELARASEASLLLKMMRNSIDPNTSQHFYSPLFQRLQQDSPVKKAVEQMDAAGILDALDDAPSLVLGELRQSAIPKQDEDFLRSAGFDDNEIEVFFTLAIDKAHTLALNNNNKLPSEIAWEAVNVFSAKVNKLLKEPPAEPFKKKRKTFNGIGKLLGGAVTGLSNVLLATGTIAAPNPATAYGAIACGAVAVASLFAGLGDLRGE
jgi:hypothetical protein